MINNTNCMLRSVIFPALMTVLFLSGCQKERVDTAPAKSLSPIEITTIEASYELPDMDTKTVRDENAKIYWTPGDAISFFFDSGTDGGSKFVAQNDAVALKTTFSGSITAVTGGSDMEENDCYFWGLYPYDKNATCDGHTVTMSIKPTQKGMEDTFAPDMAPSLGRSKFLAIPFRNIWSGFGFTVSEPGLLSVTFRGNGGEDLAGRARIGMDENGLPYVVEVLDGFQEVTLKSPDATGFVPGKYYYMQFFPGTLTNGFTVTIASAEKEGEYVYSDEMVYPRSTWKRAANVDKRVGEWNPLTNVDKNIVFADEDLKAKLVAAFDRDEDAELSYAEAAKVTSIEGVFGTVRKYKSFDEFQYFTGVTSIPASMFANWYLLTSVVLPENITQIGSDAFNGCVKLSSIVIPDNVRSIPANAFYNCYKLQSAIFPEGMTTISENAFYGCSSLTSVEIPEGTTLIDNSAFRGCTNLSSITIPKSVTSIGEFAFYNCSSLLSISIPEGVTSIEQHTFSGCSSLTSVEIPEGVTSIGVQAFNYCCSLTSITIPEGLASIGNGAFSQCGNLSSITLPESVTYIGTSAFYRCSNLLSVSIPACVISIEWGTFSDCSSLTTITIPDGVTSIASDAFFNCSSLTSITIPEGVTSINEGTFSGCRSLSTIIIPEAVSYIGGSAFANCTSLTSITIPEGVTSIESITFYGCSSLSSIIIPESVTSIGEFAFYYCRNLLSISIPEGVTSVEQYTFYGCSSLSSVEIPKGVTAIGASAFQGCSSLTSITIPEGVTSIGFGAFYDCSKLNSIIILAANPPSLGQICFVNTNNNNYPIYVPSSSLNAYLEADGWKSYASRIQAIPE